MKKLSLFLAVLMLLASSAAFAGNFLDEADSSTYYVKAPAMVARGLTHIVLSPFEVICRLGEGCRAGGTITEKLKGDAKGLVDGFYYFMDRAGRGVWDVATALAPRYNGAPVTRDLCIFKGSSSTQNVVK